MLGMGVVRVCVEVTEATEAVIDGEMKGAGVQMSVREEVVAAGEVGVHSRVRPGEFPAYYQMVHEGGSLRKSG